MAFATNNEEWAEQVRTYLHRLFQPPVTPEPWRCSRCLSDIHSYLELSWHTSGGACPVGHQPLHNRVSLVAFVASFVGPFACGILQNTEYSEGVNRHDRSARSKRGAKKSLFAQVQTRSYSGESEKGASSRGSRATIGICIPIWSGRRCGSPM
jgi:hypothetical protein